MAATLETTQRIQEPSLERWKLRFLVFQVWRLALSHERLLISPNRPNSRSQLCAKCWRKDCPKVLSLISIFLVARLRGFGLPDRESRMLGPSSLNISIRAASPTFGLAKNILGQARPMGRTIKPSRWAMF